jgi:hypothetical protein
MEDFAMDPALFGVAGPSTSDAGRVRDIPDKLDLPGSVQAVKQAALLQRQSAYAGSAVASGSGGSETGNSGDSDSDDDEDSGDDSDEDEDDEDEDEDGYDDEDEPVVSSQAAPQAARLPPLPPSRSVAAAYKGKGRARGEVDGYEEGDAPGGDAGDTTEVRSIPA